MSDFLPGSLYVDVPQTGVAVRRMQMDDRFVAMRMVPKMTVRKPSGLYTVVNMADLNRDEMEPRGPTSPAKRAAWGYSTATFSTDSRALEYDLNDAAQAAADVERNPDVMIPRVLAYKALIHMERRMSAAFFVDGVWYRKITGAGADNAGTATAKNRLYWDNASADPVEAITDEIRIQSMLTGQKPTGMVFGNRVWHKVRNNAKVKAQIVGVAGGTIGNAVVALARQAELPEFARLCGLKWCAVSEAIYNTSLEGEAATNTAIVPQDDALLYYSETAGMEGGDANMRVDSDEPAAFARFVWTGVASGEGVQIRRFRKEDAGPGGSWAHVIDVYNGFGVVTSECGTRFAGMVTP